MPTIRKKFPRKKMYKNKLPADLHEYFLYGYTTGVQLDIEIFDLIHPLTEEAVMRLDEVWETHRADIMKEWIKKEGLGSRPFFWWEWEAPRDYNLMKGTAWEGQFPIQRRQVSGKGITKTEKYPSIVPSFCFGIPEYWHEINEIDLPTFESQASYLRRHGLLEKEEMKSELDDKPETIYQILGEEL